MACSLATTIPMLIRLHLDHITLLDRLAAEVEDEIEAAVDAIPAAWGITEDGVRLWIPARAQRLSEIPGISLKLARAIIAETGLDMTRFPTASHLVSLGWPNPGHPPVRPPAAQTAEGPGRRLPQGVLHPGRQRRRETPAPSSASGSAACRAGSAGTRPSAPSDAPSSSSSDTFSRIPPRGSPTSVPAGTTSRRAGSARSAPTSANSRPSACT